MHLGLVAKRGGARPEKRGRRDQVNLLAVAHSEKYWPDAQEFRPERFKDVRPARSWERNDPGISRMGSSHDYDMAVR